jgi:hypothetical protein
MLAVLGRLMAARGVDRTWGRSLYRHLRALGLVNLGMEGYVVVWEGKSPGARLDGANFAQIQEEAVKAGFITNEEVAQTLALLDDPHFAISAPVLFTAWDRRASTSVMVFQTILPTPSQASSGQV